MNIWLVTIGEPVPVDEGAHDRLYRTGYFAHFLAEQRNNVTWWTSTFDHFRKKYIFPEEAELQLNDHLKIRFLRGCRYKRNISLARYRNHRQLGNRFRLQAQKEPLLPDIIVAAFPTIELCYEAVKFGQEKNIPVVLDMRDMWPDIFLNFVPHPVRLLARTWLRHSFRQAEEACRGATAIIGITEEFVKWGVKRGHREITILDREFPMGYFSEKPSESDLAKAEKAWQDQGIGVDYGLHRAIFIGTLGRQLDVETIISAAKIVSKTQARWQFIICGYGDRTNKLKRQAKGVANIIFPGWIDKAAIYTLFRRSNVGLDPLPNRYDFLATINNKAIEYLSAKLPIISSPKKGVLAELIAKENCGLSYEYQDSQGLAKILVELSSHEDSLKKMSDNAGRLFNEKFRAEITYGKMMEHLAEVLRSYKNNKSSLSNNGLSA